MIFLLADFVGRDYTGTVGHHFKKTGEEKI